MIKIVFLLCRSRYRKQTLNNFSKSSIYGDFLILSFCGPLFFYLGKILHKLNIFKSISIDGNPTIKDHSKGINFWFGGTVLKIPKKFLKLNNNYVNMQNTFKFNEIQNEDRVFQLYPLINKRNKKQEQNNRKIVFVSSVSADLNEGTYDFWNINKREFLLNLNLYNSMKNFGQSATKLNDHQKFKLFREIQTLIRIEIIKKIYSKFKDKMIIIGSAWNEILNIETKNIFSKKKIEELYNNNICLDLGSNRGSLSLYPRSIEILENNGALIQLEQQDSDLIYQNYKKDFTFNNFEILMSKISKLLKDDVYYYNHIDKQNQLFIDSKNKIAKQLKNL